MKKLAIGFGILIILLVGVILIVPSFLNWNEYKTQIEQTASNYTGRDVKIKGDISLSLLPMTALSVKDVTMSNIEGGKAENILSLKSLDIQVSFPSALSSIFGGRVKVKKFILVDPIVALEALSDGRVNWVLDAQIDAQGAGTEKQATTKDISLENFQIVNGQISFEDMASKQMELLRKINTNVQADSIKGPFVIAGSARYKGLGIDLDLKLGKNRQGKKMPVTLALLTLDKRVAAKVIGGIIFNEKSPSFTGKLEMTARDAGDILNAVDRFKGLKNPDHVKIGQAFALDIVVDVRGDKITVNEVNMRVGQSRGQGNGHITLGEKVNIQAEFSINKLDIDPLLPVLEEYQKNRPNETALRPQTENGKADNIVNRLSGNVDLKLGALKYNGKIASQIMLKLFAKEGIIGISTLQARMPGGASLAFKGQITPPDALEKTGIALTGDMVVKASNLRGMLDWLKLDTADIPAGQLTQFSYKSGLKVTSDLMQLYEMNGKLDAIHYQGGISYAIAPRPSYGITLNLKNLNLDSYVIQEKKPLNETANETIDLKKIFAQLSEFDVNYTIALSNITAGGFKIRSGQLNGLLLDGELDAKTIRFNDVAGVNIKASGRGANFGSKPEFTLTLSADAKSLAGLQRNIKSDYFIDLRKLGDMKLTASLSSTLEKMDVDIKSHFGVKKLNVIGTIRSATLKKFPDIGSASLDIDLQSTSLAALVDQLDLGMAKPRAADDRPVRLRGRIKTSSDIVDIDGKINIAAGEILIIGRKKGKGKTGTVDLAVDLKGAETREFIRGLGIDFKPSAKKLGGIMLKMNVAGVGDKYVIKNIAGDVGPVKLSGSGQINMAAIKPVFDFNIKAGDIPLHDFLGKEIKTSKSGEASKSYGQWEKSAMDLSLFSEYEGRVRISAGSLTYNKYIFENPAFEAILKDGLLSANNFTGRLFGGDVALSGTFGGAGRPKMALNMTLKKASLSAATTSSAGITPVTGFFDMSGQFTGEGMSQYGMMSSLSGTGKVIASAGMVKGIDIPGLSNKLLDMTNDGAFLKLLGGALSGGQTPYKGGQSNFVAKDGKIQFSPFDIELDGAKSNVRMAVDLLTWTIRSDGWLGLVDHPSAPPIGVSVTGDISHPRITYKTDRLKKFVGAKIASNLLQQLIGKEGGLEGIFGSQPKGDGTSPPIAGPDQKPEPQAVEDFGKRMLEKLFEKTSGEKDNKPPKP
ncbi:hypothetical protein MNBD_ALPHA03-778 [hydrothermal vent metagenome]|uniref:AsmA domain-containing protein n=1 Tax=hydrothermal vent metagenome TaxID=652676 RepID=A0A3B1APY7_9ZZZZ